MNLLAQLPTVSSSEIGNWLVCFAAVCVIASSAKKLFFRQPSIDAEFATKLDVKELREDVDTRFEDLRIERERNIGELHEKINGVANDVSFIRGQMERDT